MRDDRLVHVAPERAEKENRKKAITPHPLSRSVTLMRDCSLPIFDDRVGRGVVWDVVRSSTAGLHEELSVVDRGGGLDLHVDPAPYLIL